MLLLSAITLTHQRLVATNSKLEKVRILTELLQQCEGVELPIAIAVLRGEPRQGRIGVGWATMASVEVERSAELGSPSLVEFDDLVDELAEASGAGSLQDKHKLLSTFLSRCDEASQHLVQQLFTGQLRQGALDGMMIEAVARALAVPPAAVRRALTLHGDLGAIASLIATEGASALDRMRIEVGRPMQPMLAATAQSVGEALAAFGTASIEWKLDGARIQVHLRRDSLTEPASIMLFTRNLNDITHRLPSVVARLATINAHSLVADGEVLGLAEDSQPAIFQDTMSGVGSDTGSSSDFRSVVTLQPFLFDLLHLNGEDLIDHPLTVRLDKLHAVAGEFCVPGLVTSQLSEAEAVQSEALARGHEGVMVKAANSTYDAGRRGTSWRKVKPVRTLDLVVLAAEWGHGRRTGKLSNLHLGARANDGSFVMVGKTFKGMTDALLVWQTDALLALESRRVGITVFVRPQLVIEIALDGVQRSTRYPGGVALRFARIKGYRPDKTVDEADSIETLQAMLNPSPMPDSE